MLSRFSHSSKLLTAPAALTQTAVKWNRHMASANPAFAVASNVVVRPNNGPTERMNMFTAINNAMHIAMETDPK